MSATTYSPRELWHRAWALSPALTLNALVMTVGAGVSALMLGLDPRELLGEPLWLKPLKFYLSFALFAATLLYFFSFLPERRRLLRATGFMLATSGSVGMLAITTQAARGVHSHFNVGTPFDRFAFYSMGVSVSVLWFTVLAFSIALLFAKIQDRVLASTLRMGLLVTLVGMGLGFTMTRPHTVQPPLNAGQQPRLVGGHSFGALDGGPRLPLVGWNSEVGDARPAHFVGLHAIQVLPLLALGLARRKHRSEARELAGVRGVGVAYLGVTLALLVQALRGLPIVSWDALGVGSLVLAAGAGLVTFALHPASREKAPALTPLGLG